MQNKSFPSSRSSLPLWARNRCRCHHVASSPNGREDDKSCQKKISLLQWRRFKWCSSASSEGNRDGLICEMTSVLMRIYRKSYFNIFGNIIKQSPSFEKKAHMRFISCPGFHPFLHSFLLPGRQWVVVTKRRKVRNNFRPTRDLPSHLYL